MNDTYHHGDLPTALRAATAGSSPSAAPPVSACARSLAAPASATAPPPTTSAAPRGLLTSVATEGFQTLSDAFDLRSKASTTRSSA